MLPSTLEMLNAIAREEQLRLRRVIEDERLEHRRQLKKLKKR